MTERLDIIVRIKDAAKAGARSVKSGLKGIGTAATASTGALRGMYSQLAAVTALLAGGALFGGSVKTFSDFDDAMRQAGAVTNATKEELMAMTEQAKLMGKTTRYTASNSADALRLLGMAGFDAAEATAALPDVLKLAATGNLELGTAADIATNVLAGFGLEVEDLTMVNDALAKTFTSSNTTLSELGESFKLVGPIAKGVGGNFEDLLASVGKLGDAGLKGTLAGTALRGAINALFNPTKEESKLIAELSERIGGTGLQIKDSEGNFIGFVSIIKQLEKAGLRGEEALKLFGQRAGPGMAALMGAGSEAIRKLRIEIENAGGTTDRISSEMEAGLGGAIREAKSAFEAVKIAIGEAFSEDLIDGIRETRDVLISLVDTVKRLKEEGVVDAWVKSVSVSMDFIKKRLDEIATGLKEISKVLVIAAALFMGEFGVVKEALKDLGSDLDEILVKRKLLESQSERELIYIERQIDYIQRSIDKTKEKIVQDQKDIEGWRAKIVGVEAYQKQLEKHRTQLDQLTSKLEILNKKKFDIKVQIAREGIDPDEYIDQWQKKAAQKKLKISVKKIEPIDLIEPPKLVTLLKSALIKARAEIQKEITDIETQYEKNLITLEEYFNQRKMLVEINAKQEMALLEEQAKSESDVNKLAVINAKIFAKEQELQSALLELERDRYKESERLQKEKLQKENNLANLKLRAEKAAQEASKQATEGEIKDPIDKLKAQHELELQELDLKNDRALQATKKYYDELVLQAETQVEKEKYLNQQKEALNNQTLNNILNKEKLVNQQRIQLFNKQLTIYENLFGGVSDLFGSIYDASGQEAKEFFYLSKAAAIGQATMSLAAAVAKVFEQEGAFGWANVTEIMAAGTNLISTIASQSLAEGGPVVGKSPNPKADDKLIRATSGEFMQPVTAVSKLGIDGMEMIRRGAFNRDLVRDALGLNKINMPSIRYGHSNFAEGGMIGTGISSGMGNIKVELTNKSDTQLEAIEGDSYYDQNLKKYIVGVVIDAKRRNIGGFNKQLK